MKKIAVVNRAVCVACATCLKTCPKGAPTLYQGCYMVIAEKCVGCGLCVQACPKECISLEERPQ